MKATTSESHGLDVHFLLKDLLKHLRGVASLLGDRGRIHRRKEVKHFFLKHPRIHEEYFPAYVPELIRPNMFGIRPTVC